MKNKKVLFSMIATLGVVATGVAVGASYLNSNLVNVEGVKEYHITLTSEDVFNENGDLTFYTDELHSAIQFTASNLEKGSETQFAVMQEGATLVSKDRISGLKRIEIDAEQTFKANVWYSNADKASNIEVAQYGNTLDFTQLPKGYPNFVSLTSLKSDAGYGINSIKFTYSCDPTVPPVENPSFKENEVIYFGKKQLNNDSSSETYQVKFMTADGDDTKSTIQTAEHVGSALFKVVCNNKNNATSMQISKMVKNEKDQLVAEYSEKVANKVKDANIYYLSESANKNGHWDILSDNHLAWLLTNVDLGFDLGRWNAADVLPFMNYSIGFESMINADNNNGGFFFKTKSAGQNADCESTFITPYINMLVELGFTKTDRIVSKDFKHNYYEKDGLLIAVGYDWKLAFPSFKPAPVKESARIYVTADFLTNPVY